MKIKHLLIEAENKVSNAPQTYLVKNISNNQYIRLGKNETYHLLSILGELDSTAELQLNDIEKIPDEFKDKLMEKFCEWGFLNDRVKEIKTSNLEKIKKIRLIKFNVQKTLDIIYPIYSVFFSKASLIVLISMMLAVFGYFFYAVMNISTAASASVAVPSFQFTGWEVALMFLFFLLNTFLHEFAHAVTCVKYGGKVSSMGLMLFYFIPCFYCDVSSVYSFQNKKNRAVVAVSGILTNLFIGNILLIVSIILSHWNIVVFILYYMAVSTIVVSVYNLIPFVKLDGYWLLQALSGVDNLMDKSVILAYTTLFSRKYLKDIHMDPSKRRLLSIYGIISFFFHQFFWILSFLSIQNMMHFSGTLGNVIIGVAVAIVLFDFFKTLQHYYRIIKNDYYRILMTM